MIETCLCVDIGTTSLKAGLITSRGEVVSISTQVFDDPEDRYVAKTWIKKLQTAISQIKGNCNFSQVSVKALAVSGNGPTLVSQNGLTFRWNEHIVWQLFEKYSSDANKALQRSLFLPRIVMFKELYSQAYNEGYVFSGPEYLIYQLTKTPVTILPEKRFEAAYWTNEELAMCGIDEEKLPPFVGTAHICGFLTDEASGLLGVEAGLPVISGGPDFVVALIGTGTLKSGRICDRCGSSEGFNFCVPSYITAPGVRTLPSVIPDLWNCSVLIPESGNLSEEKRFESGFEAVEILKKIAEKNLIPFPSAMFVTGGQVKDKRLMQDKAIALKINLSVCQCADAELLGDACAAWVGLGKYNSLNQAADSIVRVEQIYENI